MSQIKIVLDSSADLTELPGADFAFAPLTIVTEEQEYVDDEKLNVAEMAEILHSYKGKSSSSCPNAESWLNAFGDAEEIICFTLTKQLSGSYNSACLAKSLYEEKYPGRRVEVIDLLSVGPEVALAAEKARDKIVEGCTFEEVVACVRDFRGELLFILESLNTFANNGRVSRLTAAAVGILGIRAVGRASDEGTLEMLAKCRGSKKAIESIVPFMEQYGFCGGKVRIGHCENEGTAKELASLIVAAFPTASIDVVPCRGLCSYYAEKGGILIGFEK